MERCEPAGPCVFSCGPPDCCWSGSLLHRSFEPRCLCGCLRICRAPGGGAWPFGLEDQDDTDLTLPRRNTLRLHGYADVDRCAADGHGLSEHGWRTHACDP